MVEARQEPDTRELKSQVEEEQSNRDFSQAKGDGETTSPKARSGRSEDILRDFSEAAGLARTVFSLTSAPMVTPRGRKTWFRSLREKMPGGKGTGRKRNH